MPQKTEVPVAAELRLAKALAHPLRVQILTILTKRVASPNEISQELGEGLSQVSYHVKVLKEFNCIELVRTEPRRGAVEHFYRGVARPFLTDSDFTTLPGSVRQGISAVSAQMIVQDIAGALEAGTFDSHEDRHLSRTPLNLDQQGWDDITSLLAETLGQVLEIHAEASSRIARTGERPIPTRVEILHFEAPEPSRDNDTK